MSDIKFRVGDRIAPRASFNDVRFSIADVWRTPPSELIVEKVDINYPGQSCYEFNDYPRTTTDFIDRYFYKVCFCRLKIMDHSKCRKQPISSLAATVPPLKVL